MKLHKECLEYIDDAKQYYEWEFRHLAGSAGYKKKTQLSTLRYFDALKRVYREEVTMMDIAKEYKATYSTVRNQCKNVQIKVFTYIKLKELGRL